MFSLNLSRTFLIKSFQYYLLFILFFNNSVFANDYWQDFWHKGFDFFQSGLYEEAAFEFDNAINLMSEEDQQMYPYVLVYRAENNFLFGDYKTILQDTEKALKSEALTDEERLTCGVRRISIHYINNDFDACIEEYKNYVIDSPLIPKIDYFEDEIIIRDVLDCECYKDAMRDFMMSRHCASMADIYECGNTWIINRTKKLDCSECENCLKLVRLRKTRTTQEIEACCNNCNRLAASAQSICGCIQTVSKDNRIIVCSSLCIAFIEATRQDCITCCQNTNNKCWNSYETWKLEMHRKYPECGCPPEKCPR